jgi:hypothetical protein
MRYCARLQGLAVAATSLLRRSTSLNDRVHHLEMFIQAIPPTVVAAASGGSPDAASSLALYAHPRYTCHAAEQRQRYAEQEANTSRSAYGCHFSTSSSFSAISIVALTGVRSHADTNVTRRRGSTTNGGAAHRG